MVPAAHKITHIHAVSRCCEADTRDTYTRYHLGDFEYREIYPWHQCLDRPETYYMVIGRFQKGHTKPRGDGAQNESFYMVVQYPSIYIHCEEKRALHSVHLAVAARQDNRRYNSANVLQPLTAAANLSPLNRHKTRLYGYRVALRHCSIQQEILSTLSSMSSGVLLGNSKTMPLS